MTTLSIIVTIVGCILVILIEKGYQYARNKREDKVKQLMK